MSKTNPIKVLLLAFAIAIPLIGAPAAKAPEFTLPSAAGGNYSSAAHKGHRIVISFYKGYY